MSELLGFSVVTSGFVIFWAAVYPDIFLRTLKGDWLDTILDWVVFIIAWIFITGMLNGIVILLRYIYFQ